MRHKSTLEPDNIECAGRVTIAGNSADRPIRTASGKVTGREIRILAHVARAKTNKEIARDLAISSATVKRHLENILSKLGLRTRLEAAIYGLSLNGCPAGINSACALQMWRKERENGEAIWAD